MNFENFTPIITHKIGFLYLAFAHQTDGIFAKAEQITLWKRVEDWTEIALTKGEFAQIMDEVMRWYKLEMADGTILQRVIEIAKELNLTPSFDYHHRVQALVDLMDIAMADTKVITQEVEWIQTLGNIWDVKPADIKRVCSRGRFN